MYIYIYIYNECMPRIECHTYTCIHAYIHTCTNMFSGLSVTYIHTYIHIYIHTYTNMFSRWALGLSVMRLAQTMNTFLAYLMRMCHGCAGSLMCFAYEYVC